MGLQGAEEAGDSTRFFSPPPQPMLRKNNVISNDVRNQFFDTALHDIIKKQNLTSFLIYQKIGIFITHC